MTTQRLSLRIKLTYLGLAIGAFAIGLAEFVSMSIMKEIVHGLHTTPEQGRLPIASYALGVVIGAPLLAILTARWNRRGVILGFISLYAITNIAVAFSQNMTELVVLRFFSGLPHGAYFGVASMIVVYTAPPEHRAKALSRVFVGLSASTMLGVPISHWFVTNSSWRFAYVFVSVMALLSFTMLLIFCPSTKNIPVTSVKKELYAMRNPQIWIIFSIAIVGLGGLFAIYSYIEYIFHKIAGLDMDLLPYALMLFGLGMITGTLIGGRLADWNLDKALVFGMLTVTMIMASFIFLAQHGYWVFTGIYLVGISGGLNVPALQTKILDIAGDAQSIGAAMMHSALNISNALGAYLAGFAIESKYGYNAPAMEGVLLSLSGFFIAMFAVSYGKKNRKRTYAPQVVPTHTVNDVEVSFTTELKEEFCSYIQPSPV